MSQALLFIVFRGLEIQTKVEGNSNEFPPKKWHPKKHMGGVWLVCMFTPSMGFLDRPL